MIKKIKHYLLAAMMSLSLGAPVLVPAVVSAAQAKDNNITNNLCGGANSASQGSGFGDDGCAAGTDGTTTLKTVGSKIVNIFSLIIGIVAIIMIIYGGFRYITSGGDTGRVGNAKNTLIYAILGLIIVALAQFLVRYVLSSTEDAVG